MKKAVLICAVALTGMSLAACGNQSSKSDKLSSLKAEHSSLVAESKKQAKYSHKKHSKKKHHQETEISKSTKESNSGTNKHSENNNSVKSNTPKSFNDNGTPKKATSNNQSANSNVVSASSSNSYDQTDNYHGDYSRYRTGTRKPETFSNDQDYQAYVAYYQGYNYDKSTGQMTPMNDQQLNDMRQQMNNNGGANFGSNQ